MGRFWLGILIGICILPMAGLIFLESGGMPVATRGSSLPLERFIARTSIHAAMRGEGGKLSPIPPSPENLLAGAKLYQVNCAVCHGLPEQPKTTVARGLYPHVPQLFGPRGGVTDDPVGETYWKIKNGIRLTGMPGFEDSLSDNQLWQISLFLWKADSLTPEAKAAIRPGADFLSRVPSQH